GRQLGRRRRMDHLAQPRLDRAALGLVEAPPLGPRPVEARRQELRRAAEAIAVERALRVAPRVGELRAHHVLELGERRAAEHAGLDDEPHRYVDPHLHLTFLIASPSRFSSSSTSARTALSSISARRTKFSTLNWYAIVSWLPET